MNNMQPNFGLHFEGKKKLPAEKRESAHTKKLQ